MFCPAEGLMDTLINKAVAFVKDYRRSPDRLRIKFESWRRQRAQTNGISSVFGEADLPKALGALLGESTNEPPQSPTLATLRDEIQRRGRELTDRHAGFAMCHNGSDTLADLCYAVCRSLRARVVVETGVAHGVTSAYILAALSDNQTGRLISIDLPPLALAPDTLVGYFVPQALRTRWTLHLDSARRTLPQVLVETHGLDVFVHDSLHTYAHMKWELSQAMDALRPGGVLIVDDIEGNRAFVETTRDPRVGAWFAIEQRGKDALCGAIRIASA